MHAWGKDSGDNRNLMLKDTRVVCAAEGAQLLQAKLGLEAGSVRFSFEPHLNSLEGWGGQESPISYVGKRLLSPAP